MSLVLISLVLSLTLSVANINICPNDQFKLVARFREEFQLDLDAHKRHWIAFGSEGKWTVTLVDAAIRVQPEAGEAVLEKKQKFKCKKEYWSSIDDVDPRGKFQRLVGEFKRVVARAAVGAGLKEKIDRNDPVICCAAPHSIDELLDGKIQPFAVFPGDEPGQKFAHDDGGFDSWQSNVDKSPAIHPDSETNFFWYQSKVVTSPGLPLRGSGSHVLECPFWTFIPMRITQEEYDSRRLLYASPLVVPHVEKEDAASCDKDSEECHTGITNDIVVFQVTCKEGGSYEFMRFAFSNDGVFMIKSLLYCYHNAKPEEIHYYPITRLYPPEGFASYDQIGLGWKLGSFCAACPSTSFRMTISEKEAQMNKQRLQHAFAIGVSRPLPGLGGLPATMQYTRAWFEEAATTITSGRSTTISASCNGLYLWYWTISVGSWGEGMTDIPCQFFYCTDRESPPICKPRIAQSMHGVGAGFGTLCNGHDVDADFTDGSKHEPGIDEWQTFHSGRPKPLRLQGQREGEGIFKQLQFVPPKPPPLGPPAVPSDAKEIGRRRHEAPIAAMRAEERREAQKERREARKEKLKAIQARKAELLMRKRGEY
eukprot:85411_1